MAPAEKEIKILPDGKISARLLESWVPEKWADFWQNREILEGNEHDMVHHLMVLHDCYKIGRSLETKGVSVDYSALIEFSLVHDVKRLWDDHGDAWHAVRASRFLAGLSTLAFSKTREFPLESHWLAQAIVLYHDVRLNDELKPPTPEALIKNYTFLTALLADRSALARYDGRIFEQARWRTTLDHLLKGLPDNFTSLFEKEFLEKLLADNFIWHNAAQEKRAKGTDQKAAALESGQELGILRP